MGRYKKYDLSTLSEALGPRRKTEEKRKSERKLFDEPHKHRVPEEKRKKNGRENGSTLYVFHLMWHALERFVIIVASMSEFLLALEGFVFLSVASGVHAWSQDCGVSPSRNRAQKVFNLTPRGEWKQNGRNCSGSPVVQIGPLGLEIKKVLQHHSCGIPPGSSNRQQDFIASLLGGLPKLLLTPHSGPLPPTWFSFAFPVPPQPPKSKHSKTGGPGRKTEERTEALILVISRCMTKNQKSYIYIYMCTCICIP